MFPFSPNFPRDPPAPSPTHWLPLSFTKFREHDHPQDALTPSAPLLWIWTGIGVIKGLFLSLAAYVQHNDPDPWLWVPAYAIPAGLSFHLATRCASSALLSTNSRLPRNGAWIEALIQACMGYTLFLGLYTLLLAGEEDREDDMMLEEAKELLGLCWVLLWFSLLAYDNFLRIGAKVGVVFGVGLAMYPIIAWVFIKGFHGC